MIRVILIDADRVAEPQEYLSFWNNDNTTL